MRKNRIGLALAGLTMGVLGAVVPAADAHAAGTPYGPMYRITYQNNLLGRNFCRGDRWALPAKVKIVSSCAQRGGFVYLEWYFTR